MHVTVCICTRERGASIVGTLRSLMESDYHDFDVVIVDQSRRHDTGEVISKAIADDGRFTYVHSATHGSSVARNIATMHALGPIIAFTDDDCIVSPYWLTHVVRTFERESAVAQICGAVRAAPHDTDAGFIPACDITRFQRVSSPWHKYRAPGILANMAFRLEVLRAVGPFDEVLGAGGPLFACTDGDMTYRVLRAGYMVANVPEAYVVHHGFRSWAEGRPFMRRVGIGIGAAYFKHLRMGDLVVLPTLVYEWSRSIAWRRLLLFQRYTGVARFCAFAWGMLISLQYPIDRRTRTYLPRNAAVDCPTMRAGTVRAVKSSTTDTAPDSIH